MRLTHPGRGSVAPGNVASSRVAPGNVASSSVAPGIFATGAWRPDDARPDDPVLRDGDAEIKRMYVVPDARGAGHARTLLAELERTAAAAGRRRMILETGTAQPEAMSLYRACGYQPIGRFGTYRDDHRSRCFGKLLRE